MRISPWEARFRRPEPRTQTIELPALETRLTLQEATDDLRRGQIWDKVDTYCALYVPQSGKPPRQVLNSPDGPVPTSRELFQNVGALEVMQVVAAPDERLSLLDIIGIAKNFPEQWEEIKLAIAILTNPLPQDADLGNSLEAVTTEPSGS